MTTEIYMGLMSGTSLDAVDAALVEFGDNPKLRLIATHSQPIPAQLRAEILQLCQPGSDNVHRLGKTDTELGLLYAECCLQLLDKSRITAKEVVAIGNHGQTIRHVPHSDSPFTIQIGDPNIIAAKTGITTVADFRRRDIAHGGQGAPLAPAFHAWLFPRHEKNQWILNLGGIANLTYIPTNPGEKMIGFDTGPANTLLDQWCEKNTGQSFDKNGDWARSGKIIPTLLEKMLDDAYFQKPFPKSTGREYFNLDWLYKKINHEIYSNEDIQATLTELTAKTVADAIKNLSSHAHTIYLCGGGANNTFLIERLQFHLSDAEILSTETVGIHPQWIECAAFAWLAKQTIEKKPGNVTNVTGAEKESILGGVYFQ